MGNLFCDQFVEKVVGATRSFLGRYYRPGKDKEVTATVLHLAERTGQGFNAAKRDPKGHGRADMPADRSDEASGGKRQKVTSAFYRPYRFLAKSQIFGPVGSKIWLPSAPTKKDAWQKRAERVTTDVWEEHDYDEVVGPSEGGMVRLPV